MIADENLNSFWASLMVEELVRLGVRLFCISPGSRSAPLISAVAGHPKTEAVIAHDERGAAYLAVGYAKACGKPAALIATSGTAGANYLPAVIEASLDYVPLLVFTADRPPELQDVGANQTIRQQQLFGEFVRRQINIPCPDEQISPLFLLSTIDWAVAAAVQQCGPVHLNVMFREPLEPKPVPFSFPQSAVFSRWKKNHSPLTTYSSPPAEGDNIAREVLPLLKTADSALLIIGRRAPFYQHQHIAELLRRLQLPTYVDVLHPLRFAELEAPCIEERQLLVSPPKIDCALHLGSAFVSKRLQTALELRPPKLYLHIHEFPARIDPAQIVTHRFNIAPETFAGSLAALLPPQTCTKTAADDLQELFSDDALNEPSTAFWISRLLPAGHGLFLGNSMPVRDMQLFADRSGAARPVAGNRGVSGIDGTVAAAVGFARGLESPTTLLVGDLALLHDLNSLLLAARSPYPLTIVVINNNGGGIFSFLPIAEYAELNDYFQTPHHLTFAKAAELFGLQYAQPKTGGEFQSAFLHAVSGSQSTLIEVISDRRQNLEIHRRIERMLQERAGGGG